jgi:hypothetical protein
MVLSGKQRIIMGLATLLVFTGNASGAIYALGFDAVTTSYDSGTGVLSLLADNHVMTITDDQNSQQYLAGASLSLAIALAADYSSQGQAKGHFQNGLLTIHDSSGGLLLTGTAVDLYVEETSYPPIIQLTYLSTITVEGGAWQTLVAPDMTFFNLSWHMTNPIDSFTQGDLLATSSLKMTMVPEPTLAMLLACSIPALCRRR